MAVLIGGISTGVRDIEGRLTATLFAVSLLAFLLVDLARRARVEIGRQHLFLVLHQPGFPKRLWRALVAGHSTTLAVVAFVCYAVIVAFHVTRASTLTFTVLAAPVVELAVWLAAIAHVLGPGFAADRWLREVALWIASVTAVLIVALKAFMLLDFPLLLALQSFAFAALAVKLGGRQPWRSADRFSEAIL